MIIVNYSHPFSAKAVAQIENILGEQVETRTISVKIQQDASLVDQVLSLIEQARLSKGQWESAIIHLPGYVPAAIFLLVMIQRIIGHFPLIIVLQRETTAIISQFVVEDIYNLEQVAENAEWFVE